MMSASEIWSLTKKAAGEWSEDKASRLAAALAYYTALSIAPLLVISVAVLGWFTENARDYVVSQMQQLMGTAGKDAAMQMIDSANNKGSGVFATIISVVLLLFGASGVFAELQDSMNTIWEVKPRKMSVLETIKNRFLSLAMVFGVCFLLLVSLILSTVITGISHRLSGGGAIIGNLADLLISIGIVTMLFAAIFKFLPDVKMPWRYVWLGAALTAVLFTIGKYLLGLYLSKASVASAYGTAGSLAAMLVWVYYSAQILFFGAEFTQTYAYAHGFKPTIEEFAEPVTEEARAQQGIPHEDERRFSAPPRVVAITRPGYVETRKGAVIAGAGVAAGIALGAIGIMKGRWEKRVQTCAINDRLSRVEARLSSAGRTIKHAGKELDVVERLTKVESKIRSAAEAARRRYDPRPQWIRRVQDWVKG